MAKGWGELTRRFDQTKDEPVKVKRSKKLWEVYNWEQRRRMKRAEPGLHSQGRLEREKSRETGVQGTLLKEVYEQPHLSWGPWGTSSRKDSQAGYKDAWGRASVREPLSWAARESGPAFDQLCDFCPIYFLPWQARPIQALQIWSLLCSGPAVTPAGWSHWTNVFPEIGQMSSWALPALVTYIWGWSFKIKPEEPSQNLLAFSNW